MWMASDLFKWDIHLDRINYSMIPENELSDHIGGFRPIGLLTSLENSGEILANRLAPKSKE